MKDPSLLKYLRDIIIFPVMVTVVIPYFLYNPSQHFIPDMLLLKGIAVALFLIGLFLFLYTNFLFKTIAKATLAPWSPKQNLVVVGPYKYCRNPMITGVLCILFSEALFLHSTNILLWGCFFIMTNTIFFIKVEEPYLTKTFGEQYLRYKASVPRWIPKLTPYQQEIS
jgi:protein-S-isoprenylcysteine O-methyltransferase Ste14